MMHVTVRPAAPTDVVDLPDVERLAGYLFKTFPGDLGIPDEVFERPTPVAEFADAQAAGRLWVAAAPGGQVVGFARVRVVAGYAHLDELDVLPAQGRQGIGSALLAAVCTWATDSGCRAVTLRTFRDVPWNAPFYRRRGFHVVESAALSPAHVDIEAAERARGLRSDIRVTMVKTS